MRVFTGAGKLEMTEACDQIGHCEVGRAVVTPAFALPAKWVIHAVGPYMSDPNALELLRSAYLSAMTIVKEKGCHNVVFCSLVVALLTMPKSHMRCFGRRQFSDSDFNAAYSDYVIDVLFACHGHAWIAAGNQMLENPPAVHDIKTEPSIEESHEKTTRFRIYVAKMGCFQIKAHEFIAEFENQKLPATMLFLTREKAIRR